MVTLTTKFLATAVAVLLLAGCTVGPDYVKPALPAAERFTGGVHDTRHSAAPVSELEFWRSFGDPALERLVEEALLHNHDVRIAVARYDQARALLRNARYDQLPTLGAGAQASESRASADQLPGVDRGGRDGEQYGASLGALWELDFFGRIRRGVEAQRAETQASAADVAAMQVLIVGEVAATYFGLRGLQEQLDIATESAENQARTLRLIELRSAEGMGTNFEVDRARTELESTRSRVPSLQAAVAVAAHRIAVLLGRTPELAPVALANATGLPPLPEGVATGTPSDLLRRRPDVIAAERRLAASTARIGVATADLFPRFTLEGLIGSQALDASALFSRDSETRLVAFGIDGSFLNVGRVKAQLAAANAATAGDLAAYEQTVLRALEETGNALVRFERGEQENVHLEQAAAAGARAAALARVRLENGAIDVLDVLEAERARLQVEDAFVQGRVRSTLAVVALYRALGGGWPRYIAQESLGQARSRG